MMQNQKSVMTLQEWKMQRNLKILDLILINRDLKINLGKTK